MAGLQQRYVRPGYETLGIDPKFPHAPEGWTRYDGNIAAGMDGLDLTEAHWQVVRDLQDYFDRHTQETGINVRELHDALDEKYHHLGGIRYLYRLFPGGPVAQGCRIAGLPVPPEATDRGIGSVV